MVVVGACGVTGGSMRLLGMVGAWTMFALVVDSSPIFAAGAAPVAHDVTASSLYRADASWNVTTTVTLEIADVDSSQWQYKLVHPEAVLEAGASRFTCADPDDATKSALAAGNLVR